MPLGQARPVIAVCGERFSANAGDGAIAECLVYLLRRLAPDCIVASVDLSGRLRYESFGRKKRPKPVPMLLKLLRRMGAPRPIAGGLDWLLQGRWRLQARLEPLLPRAGLVIIGGGQLLLDTELRFPLRIAQVANAARRSGVPLGFLACGAAPSFSRLGWRLLAGALGQPGVCHVSLRDPDARENVARSFGPQIKVPLRLGADPAVWAADVYGFGQRPGARAIGLGVMTPRLLRRRAAEPGRFTDEAVERFWLELILRLRESGQEVELFVNGSGSDQAFLARIAKASGLPVPPPPRTATELAWRIAGFRAVIAHRLHANVLALALGVPSVGLIWDDKLRHFGRACGRERAFVEPADQTAELVQARLEEVLASPQDDAALARLKEEVRLDILALLAAAGLAEA